MKKYSLILLLFFFGCSGSINKCEVEYCKDFCSDKNGVSEMVYKNDGTGIVCKCMAGQKIQGLSISALSCAPKSEDVLPKPGIKSAEPVFDEEKGSFSDVKWDQ